ncbi:hypothetical protein [Stutzerimonas nitrititolerans]|uniref:hypothetical protein n=1 Tax=Stutzerimonas nitrititolerans TaxID=2482751 RepID=UPI0028AD4C14|nr:hypothetical protein [Stutzerimonas nitrititolerans]
MSGKMIPLQKSWAANDLEADLRDLFIQLYTEMLGGKSDEINLYGAPHIGPFSLIEREIAKDGLAVLRTTSEDQMRNLFRAWRFRNPRRGTHFLRTYLQSLFGSSFDISQLWQKKDAVYPYSLLTETEVNGLGVKDDYFLTSRIRVDIETEVVPERLAQVLRTTVAARFVMDVRTSKYGRNYFGFATLGSFGKGLIAGNATYPIEWTKPEDRPNSNDFGRATRMLADLWSYIQRSTGIAADEAEMPQLTTTEGLVKNNQFVGGALGGYLADGAASSEGISLLMRGVANAYRVDRDPKKLAYLKFLMDAACKYFFFDSRPTADSSIPWYHTWLVNAGKPFNVRGPLAENGMLDQGGFIGVPVTFVGGRAVLDPAPDIVYQVVTPGSVFVWNNVFSELEPGTGSRVGVDYYVNSANNKIFGTQAGGSFGQPSEVGSVERNGTLVLTEPLDGTYLVNYVVSVPDVQIDYGEAYEGWPMWRKLAADERAMAADAIHWFIDAFRHLREADPLNKEWEYAHLRLIDCWNECCEQESNNTKVFVSGANGPYNNFPLTYSFSYGVDNVDDESTQWSNQPPTSYYTAERAVDGYVMFTMPHTDAEIGSGQAKRYGVVFENKPLYIDYDESTSLYIDTQCSVETILTATITSQDGSVFHAPVQSGPASKPVTMSIGQFMRFHDGDTEVGRWIPGEKIFGFNNGVERSIGLAMTDDGRSLLSENFVIPDNRSGFGITFDMVSPHIELTTPPKVCYLASADMKLTLKDHDDWLWEAPAPMQEELAERSWTWSQFKLAAYQEDSKAGKAPPADPAQGIIKVFQFTGAEGVHGTNGDVPQAIRIAYVSGVSPESAQSGDVRIFRLHDPSPLAHTWKVGDVEFVSAERREIKYYGALPFGLMIGGPSRARLAVVPFRGPYIAGYQSGTPYVDSGDADKLDQLLDFMLDSQLEFQARSPAALLGPFMHIYLPACWDSEQYGTLDTWVWDGPDGNPAWQGWQYRAFDAMARTWHQAATTGMRESTISKLQTVSVRFLDWIYHWIEANPKAYYVPSDWRPQGWSQGTPLAPDSYLEPHGNALEAHDLALVLKGAIFCAKAGANRTRCMSVIERCMQALILAQVHGQADPLRGSFSLNPADFEVYSFHQGEIMDALALAVENQDLLPEVNQGPLIEKPTPTYRRRSVELGGERILEDGRYRDVNSLPR